LSAGVVQLNGKGLCFILEIPLEEVHCIPLEEKNSFLDVIPESTIEAPAIRIRSCITKYFNGINDVAVLGEISTIKCLLSSFKVNYFQL